MPPVIVSELAFTTWEGASWPFISPSIQMTAELPSPEAPPPFPPLRVMAGPAPLLPFSAKPSIRCSFTLP